MGRHNFKKLKIWEEGMILVNETYETVKGFLDFKKIDMRSQITRSAVSISSNIAEGIGKSTDKHFNKYLEDSLGSTFEWETQLNIACRKNILTKKDFFF